MCTTLGGVVVGGGYVTVIAIVVGEIPSGTV
jgi:hypothetical protein